MIRLQVYHAGIGAKTFIGRLTKCLVECGFVKMVTKRPHIYLSSVWKGSPPSKAVHLHRADGVYFDKNHHGRYGLNKQVEAAINASHGVIYQSKYSREICNGILRLKRKRHIIIQNGVDETVYDNIEVNKLGFDKMLVSCAKWRPLKRPRSIAKGFLAAGLRDTVLVMIGAIDDSDKVKHKNIKYIGKIDSTSTYKYYKSCDGIIHISRLDACPNVVVEGLVAGKPVLCNNVGGTPELVKDCGVILDIDPPFKYKQFSMHNPDSVDPNIIASGISKLLSTEWDIKRLDLHIKTVAKLYHQYFRTFLE